MERLQVPIEVKGHKHWDSFYEFHLKNRNVIHLIISELDKSISVGKSRASIKTIIGVIRYTESLKLSGDQEYKINDAYTSIYAHIIVHNFPKYKSLIEIRKIRA